MHKLTLDLNCLINLENGTGEHAEVRRLIHLHDGGALEAYVPEIAASENQLGGHFTNFSQFEAWLERIGCAQLPRIYPMGILGLCFLDHFVLVDEDTGPELERRIHEVVHPEVEYRYQDYCARLGLDSTKEPPDRKWRNARCDTQMMWSHIHTQNTVFVTEDRRGFLYELKRSALKALGAGEIHTPAEALRFVSTSDAGTGRRL